MRSGYEITPDPKLYYRVFLLFLNSAVEIMLNMLSNTLLKVIPHNTQKRRRGRRKEKKNSRHRHDDIRGGSPMNSQPRPKGHSFIAKTFFYPQPPPYAFASFMCPLEVFNSAECELKDLRCSAMFQLKVAFGCPEVASELVRDIFEFFDLFFHRKEIIMRKYYFWKK